jgi:hypothetical protein
MSGRGYSITIEIADRFLGVLDPNAASFAFQTFDDNKGRCNGGLARMLHGTLDKLGAELQYLNRRGKDRGEVSMTLSAQKTVVRQLSAPRFGIQLQACGPFANVFANRSSIFETLADFLIRFRVSVKSQAAQSGALNAYSSS